MRMLRWTTGDTQKNKIANNGNQEIVRVSPIEKINRDYSKKNGSSGTN